jgi:hypothetical protein
MSLTQERNKENADPNKKTRHVYSHSDQKTLGILIKNLDKRGILRSTSRDAGIRQAKDELWKKIEKAFNTQTVHPEPFPIWSLKVRLLKVKF